MNTQRHSATPSVSARTVRGCALGAFPYAPPLAWPRALTHMIIARSHAQRRDWRQPRSAKQLHWARPRQATAHGTVAARLRSMSCDSSRATRLHAFQRRLDPETTTHRTRELRDHAEPSDSRITTRRRLAGGVRRTGAQRLSVRGSISDSIQGAISARVPPSCPTMIRPPSRPARSQCACSEPGAVFLETATPSALCIPSAYATPSSLPHTPHTHYRLPHSSPLQLEHSAEIHSSCLRAAIARQTLICTSDLIGGIPRPFLGITIALFQPSTSTYVATSLYDRSDRSDASSD